MIRREVYEGHSVKEVEITFEELVEAVKAKIEKSNLIKTVMEVPASKGISFKLVTPWERNLSGAPYTVDMFKGNLVIHNESYKHSISFNKDANIVLRDSRPYFSVYLNDYHIDFVIMDETVSTPKIEVKTPMGTLIAGETADPNYKGIYVEFKNAEGRVSDLAVVECNSSKECVQAYLYEDGSTDEYTHHVVYKNI